MIGGINVPDEPQNGGSEVAPFDIYSEPEPAAQEQAVAPGADANLEPERQRWESRYVFILAAIGSAVGLGNVWRFPYLVTRYGGGTFLIPYTICLFGIGMPILLMELALGQQFQGGDVEAFGKMHPRLRGIGMASIFSSMTIIAYYVVIIAWTVIYFFQSCNDLEWTTVSDADNYFVNDLLHYQSLKDVAGDNEGSWRILMGLILTWFAIYFCIYKGVLSAGIVVKITMPLPVLLLVILMIRSVILDGADGGIDKYLGNWDLDVLEQRGDNQIWAAATGQVFFTLGVCMGVMTAYSSFNPRSQNIVVDEKWISLGDYAIAFMAGFTIYAIMGHIVHNCKGESTVGDLLDYGICETEPECTALLAASSEQDDACETIYDSSGFGLAFKMYPFGLSLLPGAKFWCAIFFLMLFTLGVDSAFSLVEAVTTVVGDSQLALRMAWSKPGISLFVCLLLFMIGTLFTADTGMDWLDIVDYYVNQFNLLLVGFFECLATGWIFGMDKQIEAVGQKSITIYNVGTTLALLLGCIIGFGLTEPTYENDAIVRWDDGAVDAETAAAIGVSIGLFTWAVSIGLAVMYAEKNTDDHVLWSIMGWPGCDQLRLNVNTPNHAGWIPNTWASEMTAMFSKDTMPIYFGFFIKYLDPVLLALMILDTWRSNAYEPYGGFKPSQLAVGWTIFAFAIFLGIFPALCPILMMSSKDAKAYEGWDLSVQISNALGYDILNSSLLGFADQTKSLEDEPLKKEEVQAEMTEIPTETSDVASKRQPDTSE